MGKEHLMVGGTETSVEVLYLGADADKDFAERGWYVVTHDDHGYRIGEVGPFDRETEAEAAKADFVTMVRSLMQVPGPAPQ